MATKEKEYSSASDFKSGSYVDLTLPSGKTCAARRVAIEVFIKSGRVPNALLPMMKGALKGQRQSVPNLEDLDVEMISGALEMFDMATIEAVRIPQVHPVPPLNDDGVRYNADGTEWARDDDQLYVDEIDAEDKQFIFQWAIGGVTDVAKFRDGAAAQLADLLAGKGVAVPAKRVARAKR